MKDQINTIREALLDARSLLHDGRRQDKALTALDQIEKMVGSQVPVAWGMQHTDGAILDVISPEEHAREEGGYVVPLYRAAPVAQQPRCVCGQPTSLGVVHRTDGPCFVYEAQQPPKLEDIEQYRMQMAGICTAAMGYWKEGDSIHPDYDTPALRDVAKLYAKYDALYKAQQPQAEKPLATLEPTSSYVQPVPDHCDRIVWQNHYYHLPLKQPQAEQELRKLLCIAYAGAGTYMDDGEAQDNRAHPAIDFMRDTPAEIQHKMRQRSLTAPQQAEAVPSDVVRDAERYRFLAAHCRSTPEHWGGRWSIVIEGPCPERQDCEDAFDAAIDAAIAQQKGQP